MSPLVPVGMLTFGIFCAYIASQKNRDPITWFFIGLFFTLIALIAIGVLPSLSPIKSKVGLRKCPSCAEEVKSEAKICRFCQAALPELPKLTDSNWLDGVTEEQKLKMQQYKIVFENGKFVYKYFKRTTRFANLTDAITHAEYCEKL